MILNENSTRLRPLKGLFWFSLCWVVILLATFSSPGKGRHGKPTPTPTPSPTPAPTPTPTPAPTPPQVTLAWDIPGDPSITGYALWIGFTPGGETQENDLGLVLTITWSLTSGTQYYFVVTSYNSAHQMSVPSNEVSYLAP
jgi:hypothetical protein